jgi:hypothetical protein
MGQDFHAPQIIFRRKKKVDSLGPAAVNVQVHPKEPFLSSAAGTDWMESGETARLELTIKRLSSQDASAR